jgi:hypothetical protein
MSVWPIIKRSRCEWHQQRLLLRTADCRDYRDSDGSAARGNKHGKARPRPTVLQITYGSICDHHLVAVPASPIFFKTARFSEDGELHQAVCGMTGTYGTLMMCSRSIWRGVRRRPLFRPARQRQPHAAADQRHARQPAEPSRRRPLQEQSSARTGGNRPARVRDRGHRDRNDAHYRKLISYRQIRIDKLRQKRREECDGFWMLSPPQSRATGIHGRGDTASPLPPACRHD